MEASGGIIGNAMNGGGNDGGWQDLDIPAVDEDGCSADRLAQIRADLTLQKQASLDRIAQNGWLPVWQGDAFGNPIAGQIQANNTLPDIVNNMPPIRIDAAPVPGSEQPIAKAPEDPIVAQQNDVPGAVYEMSYIDPVSGAISSRSADLSGLATNAVGNALGNGIVAQSQPSDPLGDFIKANAGNWGISVDGGATAPVGTGSGTGTTGGGSSGGSQAGYTPADLMKAGYPPNAQFIDTPADRNGYPIAGTGTTGAGGTGTSGFTHDPSTGKTTYPVPSGDGGGYYPDTGVTVYPVPNPSDGLTITALPPLAANSGIPVVNLTEGDILKSYAAGAGNFLVNGLVNTGNFFMALGDVSGNAEPFPQVQLFTPKSAYIASEGAAAAEGITLVTGATGIGSRVAGLVGGSVAAGNIVLGEAAGLPSVGTVLPQGQRLSIFYQALQGAPAASSSTEALGLVSNTMNTVEDAYSGVAAVENPGLTYTGRMYPPRPDFVTVNSDGSLTAVTKGSVIQMSSDGSIAIANRATGEVILTKPGK